MIDPEVDRELERLDRRLMALEVVPMKTATMEIEVRAVRDDVAHCADRVEKLHERRSEFRREQEARREKDREERKKDRRWTIGTVVVCFSGLVPIMLVAVQST